MMKRKDSPSGLALLVGVLGASLIGCGGGNVACGDGVADADDLCYGAAPATVPLGGVPTATAVGDFDGDGDQDIAAALEGGGVELRVNDGAGAFTAADLGIAGEFSAAGAGDFDGDGDLDLALGEIPVLGDEPAAGQLRVFANDAGAFTQVAIQPLPEASAAFQIVLADMDGDGGQDIVVQSHFFFTSVVEVYLNAGGQLGRASVSGAGFVPLGLAAVDLDGDGDLDLASDGITFFGGQAQLYLNDGAGVIAADLAINSDGLAVGDIDGDGRQDLISPVNPISFLNESPSTLDILLGDEGNLFATTLSQKIKPAGLGKSDFSPDEVAAGDFDGDGDLDVALLIRLFNEENDIVAGRVLLFANDGAGALSKRDELELEGSLSGLTAADINGDGLADLAVRALGAAELSVFISEP
jgi:hypothetical protein